MTFISKKIIRSVHILLFIVFFISLTGQSADAKRYFKILRPRLGLEFLYEFKDEDRTGPGINRKDTSMTYSEILKIDTAGWIYHPALITFRLAYRPEWEQQFITPDEGSRLTMKNFLQGYSTEFTFLRFKPYTLKIFADRMRSTYNNSFAVSSKLDTDTYGTQLILNYQLYTILRYEHLETSKSGFFQEDISEDVFDLEMNYDKRFGETEFNATYEDSQRTVRGVSINTKTQYVRLLNRYYITADKSLSLGSDFNYRNLEAPNIRGFSFNILERLSWKHRKNLSSYYELTYRNDDRENFDSEITLARASLSHLLYENLSTNLSGFFTHAGRENGSQQSYGSNIGFSYSRKIPFGKITAYTGHGYQISKNNFTDDFTQVIDESRILQTSELTLLEFENVDLNSISITDTTGLIVYIEDIDYRVEEIDFFVSISRIEFGAIADGQEVLVIYRYLGTPSTGFSTYYSSYGSALDLWSTLKLYYDVEQTKDNITSGLPSPLLRDISKKTWGARFSYITKFTATSLWYEDRDWSTVPTTEFSVTETISLRPWKSFSLHLSASYYRREFKDTGEIDEGFNYSLNSNKLLTLFKTKWSTLKIRAFGKENSNTRRLGAAAIFNWFYAIWSGDIRYDFYTEKEKETNETRKNHSVIFRIKRSLF